MEIKEREIGQRACIRPGRAMANGVGIGSK